MVPNTQDQDRDFMRGDKWSKEEIAHMKSQREDSALNTQVGGDHYKNFPIQPIVFTHTNKFSDIQSAIIWYICRYNLKGHPLSDLNKAKHFIDILIELEGIDEYSCSDAGHPHCTDSPTAGGVRWLDKD
jgi:hypothetical protein